MSVVKGIRLSLAPGSPAGALPFRIRLPDPRVAAGERRQRRYPPHGSLCKGGGDLDRDRVRGAHLLGRPRVTSGAVWAGYEAPHPVAELGLVHAHHLLTPASVKRLKRWYLSYRLVRQRAIRPTDGHALDKQ